MQLDEIKVGSLYYVEYIDPNYPCHCSCHSNHYIKHCMPCCYDRSYSGTVLVVSKNAETSIILTVINEFDFRELSSDCFIEEIPEREYRVIAPKY